MPVEAFRYSAGQLTPQAEASLWKRNLQSIFDIQIEAEENFQVSLEAWNLGALVLGPIDTVAQRYERSNGKIQAGGLDHYLLQFYVDGGFRGVNGRRELSVRPGDISVLDLSRPVESEADDARLFNVLIPRGLLDSALSRRGLDSGFVLRGDTTMGGLLGDYLLLLKQRLRTMQPQEATGVVEATVGLVASCLAPTARALAQATPALDEVLLQRMKQYIADHLDTGRVSPDALCDEFHVSRASLYRAFAPYNGVACYVRHRRLERCLRAILDPAQSHRSIRGIVEEHGFPDQALFQRQFRRQFGVPPGVLRQRAAQASVQAPSDGTAPLDAWIRTLGAPVL